MTPRFLVWYTLTQVGRYHLVGGGVTSRGDQAEDGGRKLQRERMRLVLD